MKDTFKKLNQLQDEINFKELFTQPARLFGYSYFYILIVIVGIGIYFVQNLTVINKNTIPPFIVVDTIETQKDLPFSLPVNIPPVDVFKLSEPSQNLIERGKAFYNANCSSCHGETGQGDGPAGILMNPKPRNLLEKDGWVNGRKISEMYKTLNEGILKSGMPAYNHINPEDLFAVIHYIRTFAPDFPKDSQSDLQTLNDTYKLSEGKKSAGQIPTSKAQTLVLTETSAERNLYNQVLQSLKNDNRFHNLLLSKEKYTGFIVNLKDINISENDFYNLIMVNPILYGLSPQINFLDNQTKRNFYEYSFSFFRKKVEEL